MNLKTIPQIKRQLESIMHESLTVEVDNEGNWRLSESSVANVADDIITQYDVTERGDE